MLERSTRIHEADRNSYRGRRCIPRNAERLVPFFSQPSSLRFFLLNDVALTDQPRADHRFR